MATILQFEVRPGTALRRRPDRPCEITIFPGVRYDRRWPTEPVETAAGPQPPSDCPEVSAR